MSWQQPIVDRTRQDIEAGTSKAYCNASDLERLEQNCQEAATLLQGYLGWSSSGVDVRPGWSSLSLPTMAQLGRICQNLALLRAAYRPYQTTPAAPTPPLNHWQKWNAAEQILADIYRNVRDNQGRADYSGELSAGQAMGVL